MNPTDNNSTTLHCSHLRWTLFLHLAIVCFSVVLTNPLVGSDESKNTSSTQDPNSPKTVSAVAMADRIDYLIDAQLAEAGLSKAPLATDAEFIRRVYLDVTGTNPEPSAVVEYLADTSLDKRQKLIASVVASPAVANRLADVWTDLLVAEDPGQEIGMPARESLRRWLYRRFQENQRYDRIAGDLLIASGNAVDEPTAFFTSLELKPEKLAEKTSRVFLGVALDCAQCHDHPFDSWKQNDFWALAAYFAQLKSSAGGAELNAAMNNLSIFDSDTGEVTLPEKETVIPPRPLISGVESSLGTGSRRQQLAIWITSKQNPMFARAATNRIWAMFMGRGLIEPVDEMGTKAQASHPELIDDLANYFKATDFDIRQLITAITLSESYARSTRGVTDNADPSLYASMVAKPLTARQIANCLRQVARAPMPVGNQIDPWQQLASELGTMRGDASEFTGGVIQSLRTQHDPKMEQLWESSSSRLLRALNAPFMDSMGRVKWMYLATVCRPPTDEEVRILSPLTGENVAEGKEAEWPHDLLWALLNSSEFAITP
jgi:Protein of unknown function (DUF1549)/Protein of unknown function (DUF1553)